MRRSIHEGTKIRKAWCGDGVGARLVRASQHLAIYEETAAVAAARNSETLFGVALTRLRDGRELVPELLEAVLFAVGYRRTSRHFWRRWPDGLERLAISRGNGKPAKSRAKATAASSEPAGWLELRDHLKAARCGDGTVLRRINKLLTMEVDIWDYGKRFLTAATALWRELAITESVLKHRVDEGIDSLRAAHMSAENLTLIEEFLVDQLVVDWLYWQYTLSRLNANRQTCRLKAAERPAYRIFRNGEILLGRVRPILPNLRPQIDRLNLKGEVEKE